tara:strand:- start:558 stop:908 length:351 start_codon:yes stop_codon:yes gene_type:complete
VPLLFSCGEKKEKKKDKYNFRPLESIKKPCDCVDHLVETFKKAISKMKSDKDYNMDNDLILKKQADKITEYCDDKFEWSDKERGNILSDCDSFEEMKKIAKGIIEHPTKEIRIINE